VIDAHAESSNNRAEVVGSNVPPAASSPHPLTRKREQEYDPAVSLQPEKKRRKSFRAQPLPQSAIQTKGERKNPPLSGKGLRQRSKPLTSTNLRRLDTDHRRQESPSIKGKALEQWDFVGMVGRKKQKVEPVQESASEAKTGTTSSSGKTISTTKPQFRDIARDNGILDVTSSQAPVNLETIRESLNAQRETPEPNEKRFRKYVHKSLAAPNENSMVQTTQHFLLQSHNDDDDDNGYMSVYNQPLDQFPMDLGFNNGLSPAQPDLVEGIDSRDYRPYKIRKRLGGAAVPSSGDGALALPHMAAEWKAAGKDMVEACLQAAYDGACLVYGRNIALASIGKPDPPKHAGILTFITDGTAVHTYAHYAEETLDGTLYHQYPVTSSFLQSDLDDHKKGRRQIRNLQGTAKKHAYALKTAILNYHEDLRNNNSTLHHPAPIASVEQPSPEGPSPGVNDLADPTADLGEDEEYDVVETAQTEGRAYISPNTSHSSRSPRKSVQGTQEGVTARSQTAQRKP
jgi:hypothetical protein